MSFDRGVIQKTTEWKPSHHHCPLLLSDNPPFRELAIHRSVASNDGTSLAIPLRNSENQWHLHIVNLFSQSQHTTEACNALADITPTGPQGLTWLEMDDEGWHAQSQTEPLSSAVEFAWNLTASPSGHIAFESQSDRRYTPFSGTSFWNESYESTTGLTLSKQNGHCAAVVQTTPVAEGDLETFGTGCFTLATEKGAWNHTFLGAYTPSLSTDGSTLAADVRLPDNRCTVAVNDRIWGNSWTEVWAPAILGNPAKVVAPVKSDGRWWLYADGEKYWETSCLQLWELTPSNNGRRMAAVASPSFGNWTLALDDALWKIRVDGFISKPKFSPCDSRLAATGRHKGRAILMMDHGVLDDGFLQVWDPNFSPHGSHEAFRARKKEGFFIYLDKKIVGGAFAWVGQPKFSPDGRHLLISGIRKTGGTLHAIRQVIATE